MGDSLVEKGNKLLDCELGVLEVCVFSSLIKMIMFVSKHKNSSVRQLYFRSNENVIYGMQNDALSLTQLPRRKDQKAHHQHASQQIHLLLLLINHRSKLLKRLLIHRICMFRCRILPTLNLIPVL